MPPDDSAFVIIGLTRGLAYTENPCLARQHAWAAQRAKRAHAYGMATFPTAAQLSTHGSSGPWSAATRAGRVSNAGYAQASEAVASLRRIGWSPAAVWVDVEPRPAQPWPVGSAAMAENRMVVEGYLRGLQDAGFASGLYSYANGWREIAGAWTLPHVPVWATAGQLDYPEEARDRCLQPGFSSGPVLLAQWTDGVRDYNRTCPGYRFTAFAQPQPAPGAAPRDLDRDWNNDLLARDGEGRLWTYPGNGRAGWKPSVHVASGWGIMDALAATGDLNGDGLGDVVARQRATGKLWLYRGTGQGGFLPALQIGTGWNGMDFLTGPGDIDGDGRNDLVARHTASNRLLVYPGNGRGGWLAPRQMPGVWGGYDRLAGGGDLNGDGRADLLARNAATGELWLHPGTGSGGLQPAIRVGRGWQGMDFLLVPGDFDGDRRTDLVARQGSTGALWLYPGNGSGGWLPPVRIGRGWNGMSLTG
ncbi:FG-GAP-like repeat-containing protein [Zafaria sp. J156]|uniref:FG-GAP-like repeat-containing protein n=1 Tax=Zafaria sp. J156 TaxID=3116490 RepID=UPI002E7652F7|nr:FG-GAP-like repeat-containing protein [Zafaria sp. J156]MEE1620698.1 FG-GAP-like repeat-containing protein [Zafaria sp. J156]